MKFKMVLLFIAAFILQSLALSQDTTASATKEEVGELKSALDGINETLLEMKTTVDVLKKIKVSGYIQSQYQVAEGEGITTVAGGNFPAGVRDRFQVRRGRLKVNYDNDLTQYVLQIDVTQSGVGIKDAYASIKESWYRAVSLTGGIFDRPIGFEISYSSSSRETPERSRLFQTLFPGERELGAKIEIIPEYGTLSYFNLKAGLFNGVLNTANENDRNKDFIGRIGFQLPFEEENLSLDGGLSLYDGKVTSNSKFVYSLDKSAKNYVVDSTASNVNGRYGRVYYGADVQLYYDLPSIGGLSVRGEFITGQQPGTSSSSSFYNPGSTVTPMYIRNFNGWYLLYLQNIGLSNQLVIKYDGYDPNTDVEANDIGATGSNLTVADIKYTTFGLGWIYHWDANVKFTFYYDVVTNEKTNSSAAASLAPFRDDVNDNVFTVRMQYRF
jgi:hypothetical protein